MRLQSLLGVAVSLVRVVLCSTDDNLNIRDLIGDFAFYAEDKNFDAIGSLFTANATYNAGSEPVQGVPAIEAILSALLPAGFPTAFDVLQSRIVLGPPFDRLGAAGTATALTSLVVIYFGQGDLKGQEYDIPARYSDTLVKTGLPGYGGWRFSSRAFLGRVSYACIYRVIYSFFSL